MVHAPPSPLIRRASPRVQGHIFRGLVFRGPVSRELVSRELMAATCWMVAWMLASSPSRLICSTILSIRAEHPSHFLVSPKSKPPILEPTVCPNPTYVLASLRALASSQLGGRR